MKDIVIELLFGGKKKLIIGFTYNMTTFNKADDVLTLLVHLECLGYDDSAKEVIISNQEISKEFVTTIRDTNWNNAID